MIISNTKQKEAEENEIIKDEIAYPVKENIPGMNAYLMIDLETQELYYNYISDETIQSQVSELKQENEGLKSQIDLMQKALDDVILGGTL